MSAALTRMARRLHRRLGQYLERRDGPGRRPAEGPDQGSPFADEKEALGAVLSGLGHRNPEGLLFMFEIFLAADRHLTAEGFQRLLAENGLDVSLDRAQVTLEFFTAMGFSERHYTEDGQALYERGRPDSHHDHIICSGCGRNLEFNRPEVDHLIEKIACEEEFCHLQHKLIIYALCPQCRERRAFGLPLSETAVGESVAVARLEGDEETLRRLSGLGLHKGARLKVLGERGGAMIVLLDNCRLAMGPELSSRVMVRALGRGPGKGCGRRQNIRPFGRNKDAAGHQDEPPAREDV